MMGAVDVPLTLSRLYLAHTPPPAGRDPPYVNTTRGRLNGFQTKLTILYHHEAVR
jgi:hypothetical protein